MKKGRKKNKISKNKKWIYFSIILAILLLTTVAIYTGFATTTHTPSQILVNVGGTTMTLQQAIDSGVLKTGVPNPSWASVYSSTVPAGHTGNEVIITFLGKQMTLQDAINSGIFITGNLKSGYTYSALPTLAHFGSDISVTLNGVAKSLQDAITAGLLSCSKTCPVGTCGSDGCGGTCSCSSGYKCQTSTSICVVQGFGDVCYPSGVSTVDQSCYNAGTIKSDGSCTGYSVKTRGIDCNSGGTASCDGSGHCYGYPNSYFGTGCNNVPTGTVSGSYNCVSLSYNGYWQGNNGGNTWYTTNLNVKCSHQEGCGTSCSKTVDDTWYIKPGTAAVDNTCAPPPSGGDHNGAGTTTTTSPSGGGCFLADTPVLMADGSFKKIGNILPGDVIASYDNETNKFTTSIVGKLIIHDGKDSYMNNFSAFPLIRLSVIAGNKLIILEVTKNHPFYDPVNKEFKQLWKFSMGDKLETIYGRGIIFGEKTLIDKTSSTSEKSTIVYNLEISKGPQDYMPEGVVVHNSAGQKNTPITPQT